MRPLPLYYNKTLNFKIFNCKNNQTFTSQISWHIQKTTCIWFEYRFANILKIHLTDDQGPWVLCTKDKTQYQTLNNDTDFRTVVREF